MKKLLILGLAMTLAGSGCLIKKVDIQPVAPQPAEQAATSTTAATTTTAQPTPVAPKPAPTTTAPKTTTKKPSLQPTSPTPTVNSVKTYYVSITDTGYNPKVISIYNGDTVVWVNKSTKNHTSASSGNNLWDSSNIAVGGSYSRVFNAVGSYNYHCGAHPAETGTVMVQQR